MNVELLNKQIRVEGPYTIEGQLTPGSSCFTHLVRVVGPGLVDEEWLIDEWDAIVRARQYNNVWNEARKTAPLPAGIQEALNSGDGVYRP